MGQRRGGVRLLWEGVVAPLSDPSAQLLSGDRARVQSGSPHPTAEAGSDSPEASLSPSDPPTAAEYENGLSSPTPLYTTSTGKLAVGCRTRGRMLVQ